jgi:protein TonB
MSTLPMYRQPPLSPLRISALSAALVLHLTAFAVLVMPATPLPPAVRLAPPERLIVDFIAKVVPPDLPVPPVPPPPARPKPKPVAPTEVKPVVLAESAFQVPVAVEEVDVEPTADYSDTVVPTPVSRAAQIAYDDAPPPPYPPIARRKNWQGEVLLRVQVDERGRVLAVEVDQSSGHRLLDRAASEHVLKKWRFQPALVGGRAVVAWALVPVNFRLENG